MNQWVLCHKKLITVALDIGQTLAGIGLFILAWLSGASFFEFFKQIINLIPTSANQTPLSSDGKLFLICFPLLLIISMAFALWFILETQWVSKLWHSLDVRFQKWLAKHFTSYEERVGEDKK